MKVGEKLVEIITDANPCRCACNLDVLISKKPDPESNPCLSAANTPASTELEYLDVFDFFNMPRLQLSVEQDLSPGNPGTIQAPLPDLTGMNELNITNYLVQTPELAWLAGGSAFWTMKLKSIQLRS